LADRFFAFFSLIARPKPIDQDLYSDQELDKELSQDQDQDLDGCTGVFRIRFMDCSKTQTQIKT